MNLDEIERSIMYNMAELRVLKHKLAINLGSSQLDELRAILDQIDNNLARNVDWLRYIQKQPAKEQPDK